MSLKRKLPTLTQWHRWLGLTLSLWLLLMAISGSLLLYKNDLLQLFYPQLNLAQPVETKDAAAALDQFGNGYALMPTADRPWLEVVNADKTHFYYDASGNLLLERKYLGDLTSWLVELHHHLALNELGKDIVGVLGLLSLVLIGTGLTRWWPRRGSFRRALSVRFFNPFTKRGSLMRWSPPSYGIAMCQYRGSSFYRNRVERTNGYCKQNCPGFGKGFYSGFGAG